MNGKLTTVYLGLGSNLGTREENLSEAIRLIDELCGTVLMTSSVFETDPVGFRSETRFLNMAVSVETYLEPEELLAKLLDIEARLGRVRSGEGYSSRTIDLDILFYGDTILESGSLKIPHPLMHERLFVLEPLNEIACEVRHPVIGKSVGELLAGLKTLKK